MIYAHRDLVVCPCGHEWIRQGGSDLYLRCNHCHGVSFEVFALYRDETGERVAATVLPQPRRPLAEARRRAQVTRPGTIEGDRARAEYAELRAEAAS